MHGDYTRRYRQLMAHEQLQQASKAREAAGLPSFADIIMRPGWDKKVGHLWELDDDYTLLPPAGPELLAPALGLCSATRPQGSASSERLRDVYRRGRAHAPD